MERESREREEKRVSQEVNGTPIQNFPTRYQYRKQETCFFSSGIILICVHHIRYTSESENLAKKMQV